MPNSAPQVEVMAAPAYVDETQPGIRNGVGRDSRARIFASVFIAVTLVGLIYTFARAPVYRSTATLVVVPPTPVRQSGNNSPAAPASPDGNAAVQGQVIGSQSIVARLFERARRTEPLPKGIPASLTDLQRMLSVAPIAGTTMVELRAEGSEPPLLQTLVNTWIDVYLQAYATSQHRDSDSAGAALERQLEGLKQKIVEKGQQLEAYRKKYDIVSIERDENRVLARLKGLNVSLDKANDDRATAGAHLDALRAAIARGDPVVRPQDQAGLSNLEQRAVELREQLAEFQQRYTPDYMALDRGVKAVQERLKLVESKIRRKHEESRQAAVSDAVQAVMSARQVVAKLRRGLSEYKQTASDFSARLSEYQAMRQELDQLEALQRETQDRLVQLQVGRSDLLPEVRVLERASLPGTPIRPHYLRDAAISVGAALVLGVLAIWLLEFLTRPARPVEGRRMWPMLYAVSDRRAVTPTEAVPLARATEPPALEQARPRELALAEIQALLAAADGPERELICALLSGLSTDEAAALHWSGVDLDAEQIRVDGQRQVRLVTPLKELWRARPDSARPPAAPVWPNTDGQPPTTAELNARLSALAGDAGLLNPQEVDGGTLRHTYLAFLARQGLRVSSLSRLAGTLSAAELGTYCLLAPPGTGLPLERVNLVYPALQSQSAG